MLKLSPRTITFAVTIFFAALLGVQHFLFSLTTQKSDSDMDVAQAIWERIPLLSWIDRTDFDLHLRYHRPGRIHPDVVIVDVNERSIQELGQFPFARGVYGDLIRQLEKAGAKVAAFDITFPEFERNDSLRALKEARAEIARAGGANAPALAALDQRIHARGGDDAFAAALKNSKMPVVLGFAFSDGGAGQNAKNISAADLALFEKHSIFRKQVSDNAFVNSMSQRIPVLPHTQLLEALHGGSTLGAFSAVPDEDSVIRTATGVQGYRGMAVTSLAVRAVSIYLGVEPALFGGDGLWLGDRGQTGKLHVPLSPLGNYVLRYYGGAHKFPYIEFTDVLHGRVPAAALENKIVFIGVSATGLKDIRANPFTKDYPGVEAHATFASNMLTGSYFEKDQRYFLAGYAFLAAFGLLVGFLVYRIQPVWALTLTAALVTAFQLGVNRFFFDRGLVVPSLLPSVGAAAVLFAGVLHRYFTEEREKRMVRTAFGRYVSAAVVEEILRDQSKLKLGGQKKILTVMFCDLVGFTKLSESMDATRLTALLNEYFTRMTRLILKHHGTLDKYMGDAVMCFWGAPLDLADHASQACQTALDMITELNLINGEWKAKYGLTIGLRIGLHTGEMNVGNMGSEQVFSYTVMGDNVNLGSRLEGVNNEYGTRVMVSEATARAAGDAFLFRPLDYVRVKGKEESVEILELVGLATEKSRHDEWMHAFASGLEAYRAGRWDEATAAFGACNTLRAGDGPSLAFIERIKELKNSGQKNWDGVWKMHTK